MRRFKIDVLWENYCIDPDAIADYVQADSREEAEEIARDYLEDNGINTAKEVVRFIIRELE